MSLLLLFIVSLGVATARDENATCAGHQANFELKKVIGTWHVVAIIPEKLFPDSQKDVTCYKMDLSETDEAGLRWLYGRKMKSANPETIRGIQGTIVRQRFHSENPFDIWSKSIKEINGCFRQVLSLDTDKNEISKAISQDETMQLHLMVSKEGGQFLVQILWGRMISAVIYRRRKGVTQDQLKDAFNYLSKLRGPQRLPRICSTPLKSILHVN